MQYHLEPAEKVFESLGSSEEGLSPRRAEELLASCGKNKLKEAKKEPLLKRLLKQLADPMIIILLCAAAVSALLDVLSSEIPYDTFIILFVVAANAVLGLVQENKAESAIAALQEMAAATSKVIRGGKLEVVKSEEIVPGDVIVLEAGDAVPADCRIFECASMKIEESALTGESLPVSKLTRTPSDTNGDIPLGDRKNMAYMGSTVVYGRGRAVVTDTGMNTEMGKIADAISKAEEGLTPLQKKLAGLSKILSVLVICICVFIFGFNLIECLIKGEPITAELSLASFMTAVSLAVAAIPEGLVAVVTIVLSMGVTNMSRKNAIIRKLTAVETLGCAQVICSDKTGTLTQNKMTVVEHYGEDEKLLATGMALCSDAEIDGDGNVTGEPTEAALVSYADSLSLNKNDLKHSFPRVGEAPFDSGRKMMSTVHSADGGYIQYTKGAPDEILRRCTHVLSPGGEAIPMSDDVRAGILSKNKDMADRALRVLACAFRTYDVLPTSFEPENLEHDLVFIGLTGMTDPVRPEVSEAIAQCRRAGIIPVMITGDHKDTAVAIAMQLGIISDPSQAITGTQLSEMSDEEFSERVGGIFVYARVQPEHKTRIVNAWKARGYVTAMTGDGVNDAPSIKSADIGIGMGITGTDVTKNVADMVLADDNFATIVGAVGEGRRIYDNIRRAIQFLLSSNLSEVLAVFFASVFGFTILRPTHLLFINLVTDSFPALALGVEKAEKGIMERKPRKSSDGIFSDGLGVDVVYQGVFVAALTIIAYFIGKSFDNMIVTENGMLISDYGMTMAFLTMSMCEIFHSFNMRSRRGSVFTVKSANIPLFGAMLASLALTAVIIEVPVLADMFGFAPLDITHYLISMGLAFCIIPAVEIVKLISRAVSSRRSR